MDECSNVVFHYLPELSSFALLNHGLLLPSVSQAVSGKIEAWTLLSSITVVWPMYTGIQKSIVVTDASFFIGSYILGALLWKNYYIRGTVHDSSSPKLESLDSLPNGKKLSLAKADLLEPRTFPSLLQNLNAFDTSGCSIIYLSRRNLPV